MQPISLIFDRLEEEEDIEEDGEKFEEGELVSGVDEEAERDGKFLLYWKTTTLTSTSTTYTVTHSLKKLECTPSGFDLAGNYFLVNSVFSKLYFQPAVKSSQD